jgi:hypothetical protein
MQRVLTLISLFILSFACPTSSQAAEPQRLKFSGQEVDYALWNPVSPGFSWDDVALSPERLAHFTQEDADQVVGLLRVNLHVKATGAIEETKTEVIHYLKPMAIRDDGNSTHWVDGFAEVATVLQAYALLPDGQIVKSDVETVQMRADDEDRIFSDSFQIIVPHAGLKPGAATVFQVRTIFDSEKYPYAWSDIYYPQWFIPGERFEFNLSWDEGVEEPLWRSDLEALSCERTAPRKVSCRVEQIAAYPKDADVSYHDNMPSLVVAEQTSWQEIARQSQTLAQSAYSDSAELEKELDAILEGTEDPIEKLARIHRFVSQEIRYLGLEHGLGGVIPRPTQLTLQRRFGDCKDKATLFIDLARRAGMSAYPVLTSTRRKNPDKLLLPGTSYFDHMISCVALPADAEESDREICVDLTDPYSSFDNLSVGTQGAVRLDILADTREPAKLPQEQFAWGLELEIHSSLNADGSLLAVETRKYSGANSTWVRQALQTRDRDEREKWLLENYQETRWEEANPDFSVSGHEGQVGTVTIHSESLVQHAFDANDLETFAEWDGWLTSEADYFKSKNESHSYDFAGMTYRAEMTYVMPETHRLLHAGAEVDFDSEFGNFRRHYRMTPEGLKIVTELSMPRATVPADKIESFNRFIEHVRWNARITFGVERIGEG